MRHHAFVARQSWGLAALVMLAPGARVLAQARPVIVLVHGRAQEYQIGAVMEHDWRAALDDGLRKVGLDGVVQPSDVMFVRYEQVTEHAAQTHPPCTGTIPDLPTNSPGFFFGISFDWYLAGPRSKNLVQTRDKIARWGWVQDLVIRSLPDVQRYLDSASPQDSVRCETERPLKAALDSARRAKRPVVLVAHSLGSLVSYRVLHETMVSHDGQPNFYDVRRLVTFGSQLNLEAIRHRLIPGDTSPPMPFTWPEPISWVNLAGYGDYIASSPDRRHLPSRSDTMHREFEIFTWPGKPHAFEGYLKHVATARSIAAAWCNAFSSPPQACGSVADVPADSFPVDTVDLPKLWLAAGIGSATANADGLGGTDLGPAVRLFSSLTTPLFPVLLRFEGWRFPVRAQPSGSLTTIAFAPVITPLQIWKFDAHVAWGRELTWGHQLSECRSCHRWGSIWGAGVTLAGDHWMIPIEVHRLASLPTSRGGSMTIASAALGIRAVPIWK